MPSSRCLSRTQLIELALKARDVTQDTTIRSVSGSQLIRRLEQAALIHPIPLTCPAGARKVRLYAAGFTATLPIIPPAELLQVHVPNGVLCYFSAIELHELSTQPAPHYHVAILKTPLTNAKPGASTPSTGYRPPPLGTLQFQAEGVDYYLTRRDPALLPGIQRRQLNPYCVVRVTTLEQTLLDGLHRPRSVGGAAIVFEAWERGLQRTTPDKIVALARRIDDDLLLRRVGCMIEHYTPDAPVLHALEQDIVPFDVDAPSELPSLLPGLPYARINARWGLREP